MTDQPDAPAAPEDLTAEEYKQSFPPVVYVPTTDDTEPTHRRVILHTLTDGRSALFVYSAPDRLNRFYRPDHPWVLCDGAALQAIFDETPFDCLLLDVDPDLPNDEG